LGHKAVAIGAAALVVQQALRSPVATLPGAN
jgi:hypothetical protein